jgi:hypothetical protein
MLLALSGLNAFDRGAWLTGVLLLVFAAIGKANADRERTTTRPGGPA